MERLVWSPIIGDLYGIRPFEMEELTPIEVEEIHKDIQDALQRKGMQLS